MHTDPSSQAPTTEINESVPLCYLPMSPTGICYNLSGYISETSAAAMSNTYAQQSFHEVLNCETFRLHAVFLGAPCQTTVRDVSSENMGNNDELKLLH